MKIIPFSWVVDVQSIYYLIWNYNFVTINVWKTRSILEIENVWNNSTINIFLTNVFSLRGQNHYWAKVTYYKIIILFLEKNEKLFLMNYFRHFQFPKCFEFSKHLLLQNHNFRLNSKVIESRQPKKKEKSSSNTSLQGMY